jgi:hypothetical protein
MPQENVDETYSVIYAALKHPVRRRILRMLNESDLTYTEMLNRLGVDTGHLNYYLEGLGELVAKNTDAKYRLSEFGIAAVKLMAGVEETEPLKCNDKTYFSKRKMMQLSKAIAVITMLVVAVFLMNIAVYSNYKRGGSTGAIGQQILEPNSSEPFVAVVSFRDFPNETLTNHYKTYLEVDITQANATFQVQVVENIQSRGRIPNGQSIERFVEWPTLIYNQTCRGPIKVINSDVPTGNKDHRLLVPVMMPMQKGIPNANSFVFYNVTLTNLGGEGINSDGDHIRFPNDTGAYYLKVYNVYVEETAFPYLYYGIALASLAGVTLILPYLPRLARKTAQKIRTCR